MRRLFIILATVAVVGSGLVGAVAAVVAFEAQVVQVGTQVSNALKVTTGNDMKFGASFPQEFLTQFTRVELSDSFKTQSRLHFATVNVVIECAPGTQDLGAGDVPVEWMGDFAYLAKTDPQGELPGGPPERPCDRFTNRRVRSYGSRPQPALGDGGRRPGRMRS